MTKICYAAFITRNGNRVTRCDSPIPVKFLYDFQNDPDAMIRRTDTTGSLGVITHIAYGRTQSDALVKLEALGAREYYDEITKGNRGQNFSHPATARNTHGARVMR